MEAVQYVLSGRSHQVLNMEGCSVSKMRQEAVGHLEKSKGVSTYSHKEGSKVTIKVGCI